MLGLWPIIAIWLYRSKSATEATLWTVMGGHMFLPTRTEVDLPFIPALDKQSIAALSAFLVCRFIVGRQIPLWSKNKSLAFLLLLFVIGPFFTAELNGDQILIGGIILPGLTHYDALSTVINQIIIVLPFFLGKELFKTHQDQLSLFKVLVVCGLLYSIFILYEVRMSPQLHKMVYGFFPHSFGQQVRFGGFRPVVFMTHGLWVAIFIVVTVIAATAFCRLNIKTWRLSANKTTYYLLIILVLCKSVASIVYGFVSFLLIRMTSFKIQLITARLLVIIALLYPVLSIMNMVPHKELVSFASDFDAERAQSLDFRFQNELIFACPCKKRLIWGWGGWNRNRVYNEETEKGESTADGQWIQTVGTYGLAGFLAQFGLLTLPVIMVTSGFQRIREENEKIVMAAHTMLVSFLIIDQIPNSTLEPWIWLIVGVLFGRAEFINKSQQLSNVNDYKLS
ncbi:hypothetical protein [Methylocucumis oryzae]|uniref:hypothetical protein n=1 Tax=Methylocucumis oryzae TaxID=1632867 RepID=UPI0006980C18|nr:hypothetical protein [Methylocucumis oryzae]